VFAGKINSKSLVLRAPFAPSTSLILKIASN